MIISISTQTEYTPDWNDNKKDTNPIIIEHLTPSMTLYNELIVPPSVKMNIDKDGKMDGGETEITIDNKKIVRKMVTKVRNLTIEIDGKPMEIKNGAELFGPGTPAILSGLVEEIGTYLQGILSEKRVDTKN